MTRRSPEGASGADDAIPRDDALYACRGTSCHAAGWHGTPASCVHCAAPIRDLTQIRCPDCGNPWDGD